MKRIRAFVFTLLLCLALMPAASADMGPKPSLTIQVKNAPEGVYYLDLLIPEEKRGDYDNLGDRDYDETLLAGLHGWEGEGWHPAFAGGTRAPLFGDLVPGEDGLHHFSYHGLPETFRVAVSGPEGSWATEQTFTRAAFYTNLVYDYESNTIVKGTAGWQAVAVQFLFTLIPTLVVEGFLLLAFGFRWRENWRVFLLANLATQAGLHLFLRGQLVGAICSYFPFYLLILALPELVILLAETAVYVKCLKGRGKGRRAAYAVTANLASLAAGFLPLGLMVQVLMRL